MSFLGKLLVGFQFFLSLFFLAFAGAVYTTQQNWKAETERLTKDLATERSGRADDATTAQKVKADLERDLKNESQKAAVADGQVKLLQDEVASLKQENTAAKTERDDQRTLAAIATEEARQRRDEALLFRGINNNLDKLLNDKNEKVKALEDIVFNKTVEEKTLQEKHSKLLQEAAVLQKIIAANGLSSDPKTVIGLQAPPPKVDGEVLETKRGGRSGSDLVEISIGSDDGLVEGHKLNVYRPAAGDRAAKFLGEIKLVYVTPDRAVGTVVFRAKNGIIEKGDNVASQL